MVAPLDVAKVVNQIMSEVAVRYGFVDFKAYVAKSGRIHLIDIVILVSEDFNKTTIEMDGIRDEISRELSDYARPDQWLTISFTTRREWL